RDLAAAASFTAIIDAVVRNIGEIFDSRVFVLLPEGERLEVKAASDDFTLDMKEQAVADWAFRNRQPAGRGTETLMSASLLYLPLQTAASQLGVVGIRLTDETEYRSPQTRRLLDAFAAQTAMAMERVQFSRQAAQAQLLQARENLERALLNSISHDLRSPLVTIMGVLGSVLEEGEHLDQGATRELLSTARDEAARLNRFVGNLLDMTRLEAGAVNLKKEPSDVQDLIGCSLAAVDQRLGRREVRVDLAPGLPLVPLDMVLMTQVLVNLLDNALKYSPPDGAIQITAEVNDDRLCLAVADRGPGVPAHDLQRVFDKFYRIPVPEGAGGTGLGLSICKGLVEAHGGSIRAENRHGGGLKVTVRLPVK
ncbi:MAG TPA: ATP-binding protein, partial [Geobacteraceae bacterium]